MKNDDFITQLNIDKNTKSLLKSLLEFNPYFRKSAKECLQNPMFEDLLFNNFDKLKFPKVQLDIDKDDAFDYEKGSSSKYKLKDYLDMILLEVKMMRQAS